MVWHRNSIGNLIQRLFFSLIMMSSILTFKNCIDDVHVAEDLKQCLIDSGIPLIIVLFIVTLKVSCTFPSVFQVFLSIKFLVKVVTLQFDKVSTLI